MTLVLIETYWNVNFCLYSLESILQVVLIETYWNVNVIAMQRTKALGLVLIETYWNVNKKPLDRRDLADISLNRNILECKFKCGKNS